LLELEDPKYAVRDKARRELEHLGDLVLPALRQRQQDSPPLLSQRQIESLRDKLEAAPPSRELLRVLRAIEVLELIGSAEARRILESLAAGVPEHRVTQAAADALRRLRLRP
jgi:hypothetical protein